MTCKYILAFIFSLLFSIGFSQSGGDNTYDFLSLPSSARTTALGGSHISVYSNDLSLVYNNPALLTPEMHNQLSLNFINYFAGINYGYASYAWKPNRPYTLAGGIYYANYGEFIRANSSGQKTGTFNAAEYSINLFYSRSIIDSLFQVGINFKPVFSDLENYSSFGLALDAGITYHNVEKLFTASLIIKNAGFQITKYHSDGGRETLPFEIQIGASQKLKHAPFRISVLAQQLQEPNLRYKTEKEREQEDNPLIENSKEDKFGNFGDNLMRHMVFGVELFPDNAFNLRVGYNYKRRKEMRIEDRGGMVGFSWGFGLNLTKFNLSYSRSSYHIAGGLNNFTLNLNLSEFGNKL